jgi:hypothetical protein
MKHKLSRMDQELLEMAEAQRRLGIMAEPSFQQITLRHSASDAPISREEMRPLFIGQQPYAKDTCINGGV